ncbi:hypothetical protein Salat_1160800 [Sesamum alatum]|uniref:Uncharacterized protein n=1 Tax=Sesamum alatum TaxID=300844 RepID=A0AAE1YEG0_9LAMI|nr:hypothetical protein Salat_1160800 [Sesamum alatum]
MAFGHSLSLKCMYKRKKKFVDDTKLAQSEASRLAAEEKIKQLGTKLEDQGFRSQVELETARTVAVESGKTEGFSAGGAAGKEEGFERCKSQVQKLKGFVEGFDLVWLDPTLDHLATFPEEEAPLAVDGEFESLIKEVEKMDAPPSQ